MKFLVVGLGSIGQRHVRVLQQLLGEKAQISAYRTRGLPMVINDQMQVDRDKSPEEIYGLRVFEDFAEALDNKPDAVIVTNPNSLHVETALQAARHGCHLFIEKPLSDNLDMVNELIEVVREKNLVTFIGYQLRFHPGLKLIHDYLIKGAIGNVVSAHIHFGEYLPGMHPYEDYREGFSARSDQGGGAILCLSHEIDYACWLFGAPRRVMAMGGHLSNLEIDVEDTASILFECFANGRVVPVHVYLDFVQRPPSKHCRIIGEKGTLLWDYHESSVAFYDSDKKQWDKQIIFPFERTSMFREEMAHFLACIRGAETSLIPVEEGASTLRAALAAQESLREGRIVEVADTPRN